MERDTEKFSRSGCFQSRQWDVADALRSRSANVWVLCASVSFLSSKYILVDLNFHYPFHLHLCQLAVVAALTFWKTSRQAGSAKDQRRKSARPTTQQYLLLLPLAFFTALSAVFGLIAILHFPNPTTLIFLSTLSYLPEMLVNSLSAQCDASTAIAAGRMVLLATSCAGILLGEYRLLVNGLVSWFLSLSFAGISRLLYAGATHKSPEVISDRRRLDTLTCSAGAAITIASIWIFQWENTVQMANSLHISYIPILLVNMISTAGAILLGKSVLFPTYVTDRRKLRRSQNASTIVFITAMLVLSGITGIVSTLGIRRAYVSSIQIFCFTSAILCIGISPLLEVLHGWRRGTSRDYVPLPVPEDADTFDNEEGTPMSESSDWSSEPRASGAYQRRQSVAYRALFLASIVAFAWTVFGFLNFSGRLYPTPYEVAPILDFNYTPDVNHDIVISMFKEPLEHVSEMLDKIRDMHGLSSAHIHVYVKDPDANTGLIQSWLRASSVTILPNVGREGEAYLYHIIHNWDTLARQTFFLQADVHNPREFYPRIKNYFDPIATGMLSLGWSGNVCNCHECGDKWNLQDPTGLFPRLHAQINNATSCDQVLLSYKGQFVTSAKRIRGVDKKVYEDLREAFVDPESWAHSEPYLMGRPDSMNAPQFGYQMERMWNLLFQCSDMNVAFKCPSLVSGAGPIKGRYGGSRADCQCFDPVP